MMKACLLALGVACATPAQAQCSPSEPALPRAAGLLTPQGAEAGGNADGSIPPWRGGLLSPPAGWTPDQGYVDPFAGEKPLFVIDAGNAAVHRARLSLCVQALLARVPGFRMPVYASHRSAGYGKTNGPRFAAPTTGLQAITNHLQRDLGGGTERSFDALSVRASGEVVHIGFHERRVYDSHLDEHDPNRLYAYLGWFTSPADLRGTVFLVHEPRDAAAGERKAWVYNAGQRRVRRAPDVAYDNVQNGSDGLAVVDQYDGFNGATDRFEWTLCGKAEMFVAYNGYRLGDKGTPVAEIVRPGTVNAELMRYELHRVWLIEATLKPGLSHLYARRVFYLDEDSWSVLLSEAYDARGQLWRVGIHGLIQFYDAALPWYRFELWHDLSNGSYVLTGLDNASREPWRFGVRGRVADFSPDALRRFGH